MATTNVGPERNESQAGVTSSGHDHEVITDQDFGMDYSRCTLVARNKDYCLGSSPSYIDLINQPWP